MPARGRTAAAARRRSRAALRRRSVARDGAEPADDEPPHTLEHDTDRRVGPLAGVGGLWNRVVASKPARAAASGSDTRNSSRSSRRETMGSTETQKRSSDARAL